MKKYLTLALALIVSLTYMFSMPLSVMALDEQFYSSNDILFYKPDSCAPSVNSGISNNKIYVIGDSYADNLSTYGLKDKLTKDGYSVSGYNASVGRSISGEGETGDKLPGLKALEQDKSMVTESGTALVVLGTNGLTESDLKSFMDNMHSYNPTIRTFWVNINYVRGNGVNTISDRNKILSDNSSALKYTVIDWYGASKNKNYFTGPSDGIHPTEAGFEVMIDLILKAVQPAASAPSTGGKMVTSKDIIENARQVWQFLLGKGLTPVQAAGIIGNLSQESAGELGVNPRTVQGGAESDEISATGGYGMVQWTTAGRKAGLQKLLDERKKSDPSLKASDLQLQADYMWQELTSETFKTEVLNPLLKASTIEGAVEPVLRFYEEPFTVRPAPQQEFEKEMGFRVPFARQALEKFSGLNGLDYASGGTCSGSYSGSNGWDLEGSNAMVHYTQGGGMPWSNECYGYDKNGACCSIAGNGCGCTSLAMVVATLVDKKITPSEVCSYMYKTLKNACGTDGATLVQAGEHFGLTAEGTGYKTPTDADFDKAVSYLRSGGLVIGSFGDSETNTPTLFTTVGHFMVIRKVSDDGQKFYMADPNGDKNKFSNTDSFSRETLVSHSPNTGGWLKGLWYFKK